MTHQADADMLSEIPNATSFVTSIFVGRGHYDKHESADLVTARAVGQQMADHYRNGRKALVYAQLPNGRQFLVPDNYQPEGDKIMKTYNKKFNAQRAAKSLAKRFVGFTAGDPVAVSDGEWAPNVIAPQATIGEGVPEELAACAYVNGAPYVAAEPEAPIAKSAASKNAKAAPKAAKPPRKGGIFSDDPLAPPDFSANTHARFRGKLATLTALVEARDVDGIRKFHVNPVSSSPKALMRYKERALAALTSSG